MSTLLAKLGLYTYEGYLKKFEEWVQRGITSSVPHSQALVEYTKLNWTRTQRIHKTILITPELKTAVEKIKHYYTWILLTEAWCGDSAQNLPVIAEIAKLNTDKIKLFILLRDENPELMDRYLTNGARAIPKLIAIDETLGKEAFVWGPRPLPAQQMLNNWKTAPGGKNWEDFERELHGWYTKDRSVTLQAEFLEIFKQLELQAKTI
ncbi:MAG: thioredoxin family protein [Bacteroidetes bacterium]|nr:thioredoxin family protein [Bacteroidota bacterium]